MPSPHRPWSGPLAPPSPCGRFGRPARSRSSQPPVLFDFTADAADVASRLRRTLIPDGADEDADRWARLGRAAALTLASPSAVVEETSETQLAIHLPVGPDGWIRARLSGTGAEASGTFRFVPTAALTTLAREQP